MQIIAQAITASGIVTFAASSPVVRRTVRTFFAPAGRHRANVQKTE